MVQTPSQKTLSSIPQVRSQPEQDAVLLNDVNLNSLWIKAEWVNNNTLTFFQQLRYEVSNLPGHHRIQIQLGYKVSWTLPSARQGRRKKMRKSRRRGDLNCLSPPPPLLTVHSILTSVFLTLWNAYLGLIDLLRVPDRASERGWWTDVVWRSRHQISCDKLNVHPANGKFYFHFHSILCHHHATGCKYE